MSNNEAGCDKHMKFLTWQDGSQQRYNPRCIYGLEGCVLLVCKIYRCPNGHFIATSDPRFLVKFNKRCVIPFFLLHKAGVTRELQYTIFHHCALGISFHDIHKLVKWSIQTHLIRRVMNKQSQLQEALECPDNHVTLLSIDLIINCFVITYNEVKGFMSSQMSTIKGEMISCDHTFKLASHVGIYRCGKWVPQYDSLFIIQNKNGEVLYWQLTMGTAYSAIRDGIEHLKTRNDIKMVVIDNCWMWRNMLTGSLGNDIAVKLDLFHAVKRISTAISKKHPYFFQALQDFRLVFRSCGDNGMIRKQPTPSPDKLLQNLQVYLSKWTSICDQNSNPILTTAVFKEINNLKIHINRGCLSGIPAHFGTNRNENFHRSLNSRFSGNRLGVEVAVALIAVFLHMWNNKRNDNDSSSISQYLMSSFGSDALPTYEGPKFGIGVSSKRTHLIDNVPLSGKCFSSDTWNTLQTVDQYKLTHKEIKLTNEDSVYNVLHDALSLLHAQEVLNKMSDSHVPVGRVMPFLEECSNMRRQEDGIRGNDCSEATLINILKSVGLTLSVKFLRMVIVYFHQ